MGRRRAEGRAVLVLAGGSGRPGDRQGHRRRLVPGLEKNIGYAWVPIELAAPGTTVDVESEHGPLTVATAKIPFVDARKEVPAASLREA